MTIPGADRVKTQQESTRNHSFKSYLPRAEAEMHDVPSSDGNGVAPVLIEMDTLIVGAGPAGGALASFLAFHGQPRISFLNPLGLLILL